MVVADDLNGHVNYIFFHKAQLQTSLKWNERLILCDMYDTY